MQQLERRIPPLLLCVAGVLGAWFVSNHVPIASLAFPGRHLAALAALSVGVAIAVAGVREFRRAGTTVNPLAPARSTAVVDTGVYRFTRNPMYLGMALAVLAGALWHGALSGLMVVALFAGFLTRFQILPEERALLASFGPEYAAYMSRVRRWI